MPSSIDVVYFNSFLSNVHASLKIPMIMLIIVSLFPIKVRHLNFDDHTILFVYSHAARILGPKWMALLWWFDENNVFTFVSSIELWDPALKPL